MGSTNKMIHFRWIPNIISILGEEASWVISGLGVSSQKIEKQTLNFEYNVLIPICVALVVGLTTRYEFSIA